MYVWEPVRCPCISENDFRGCGGVLEQLIYASSEKRTNQQRTHLFICSGSSLIIMTGMTALFILFLYISISNFYMKGIVNPSYPSYFRKKKNCGGCGGTFYTFYIFYFYFFYMKGIVNPPQPTTPFYVRAAVRDPVLYQLIASKNAAVACL